MTIGFKRNDWLVVASGTKRLLGQAVGKTLLDIGTDEEHRFTPEEVLANIGQKPPAGESVFGKKIDTVFSTHELKTLRPIPIPVLFHVDVKPATKIDAMLDAFNKIARNARKLSLSINVGDIAVVHVRKPSKTLAGYKTVRGETPQNQLLISADDVYSANAFAQALGLHLWHTTVPPRLKAQWLKLLHKLRRVQNCTSSDLEALLTAYQNAQETDIRSLHNLVSDDNAQKIVATVIRHFRQNHNMSPQEVDMLCAEDKDLVGELWPEWTSFTEQRPEFPDTALKSAPALFAHAMQIVLTSGEKTLPKSLQKPTAYSIKLLTGGKKDEA